MTAHTVPRPAEPDPDTGRVLSQAATLINAGQNKEAAQLLMGWYIRVQVADPRTDYLLGVAAFRSGDLRTAEGAFRRCATASPADAAPQYGLGTALLAQGDRDGARSAFAAALRADPGLAAARRQLDALTSEVRAAGGPGAAPAAGSAGLPGRPAPPSAPAADPPAGSLADVLDRRSPEIPGAGELTGGILWAGRPAVRSVIVPAAAPFALLLVPLLLHRVAAGLPAGGERQWLAGLWRLASAWALPAAVVLTLVAVANWLMREFELRERRLEVWTGLFRRRHVVLWLHDIERPAVVRQRLWHLGLNLGTLELSSTILPQARGRRHPGRLGQLRVSGLPIDQAEMVAAIIWRRSLWERRRMVQNFVSSR